MDLFEKLKPNELAAEAMEKGIYPYFHALETRQDIQVVMEGKRRIMLGSNNYLGLTNNPEVIEAGKKALDQYGSGCSGSRFLNGTLKMHLELEEELADFLHKEAVVTFPSGFQSNLGIISALAGRHDYILCDRENHASIYDGCRLSQATMLRYRHGDMADLEKKLKEIPDTAGFLLLLRRCDGGSRQGHSRIPGGSKGGCGQERALPGSPRHNGGLHGVQPVLLLQPYNDRGRRRIRRPPGPHGRREDHHKEGPLSRRPAGAGENVSIDIIFILSSGGKKNAGYQTYSSESRGTGGSHAQAPQ